MPLRWYLCPLTSSIALYRQTKAIEMERIKTILIALFLATTTDGWAVYIRGWVGDATTHEAIIGATIYDASGQKGTVTDIDGNFSLEVKDLPAVLSISFIGYEAEQLNIDNSNSTYEVLLQEEHRQVDEVVVVGYGTQKRTQLTGSVTTVRSEVFANSISPTLDAALGGQVAGLNVTASSGQPGAASSIRIRGGNSVNASNEPLYVVDGFIYFRNADDNSTGLGAIESSLNPLATINPNDIQSIEVLKDVSATAIYGSRGANGVILITTKKGDINKTSASYTYSVGFDKASTLLDLMNASEWAAFQKKYFFNKGGYTDDEIAALGEGTSWQEAMLRTAIHQSHEVSVSGGNEKSRFAFSGSYADQDGIVINSGLKRYNFHVNTEREIREGLRFGINATFGKATQEGLTTSEEVVYNSSPFSAGITNSFVYGLLTPQVVSIYNEDGSYNYHNPFEYAYFAIGDKTSNAISDLKNSVAESINNYLLSNVWATYNVGDFTLKASVGLNREKLTQNYFSPSYTSLGLSNTGMGGIGNRYTEIWQQEYTATWNPQLSGIHCVDALVGYTRQKSTTNYNSVMVTHFTNEELKQYNLADGSTIYPPSTGISDATLNSIIARVNYTLHGRYNVTATLRADNSSRFAENYRWGYFPSLGISWNVDKEAFFSGINSINTLKIRASLGTVGNQEISDHAFTTTYATGQYNGASSYSKNNAANDNLKWETTSSYNIGIDTELINSRIGITMDIYYKKTKDLLLEIPMGFSSGVTSQLQNVGNVENKGVELSINGTLLKREGLVWNANINLAHNINSITDMGSTNNVIMGSSNQQILRKGEALGSFYGLKFAGIVSTTENVDNLPKVNGETPKAGQLKFVDTNNDGKIDGNDRVVLGSSQPKLTYGFSSSLVWNKIDFSVAFQGSYGNKLFNSLGRRLELTGDSYNLLSSVLDSWTEENQNARLPYASYDRPFSYIDSRYVEDASYLKLRNITIGYRPTLENWPVSIRIYATAQNLITISKYSGYDPEVSSGTDTGAYPAARSFSMGINLTL
ncbi:MAG: TonB-dependent receptor [Bacteroidales bacterium]|nr:TonB-dependent receptor [Bacteroidales bacterium]